MYVFLKTPKLISPVLISEKDPLSKILNSQLFIYLWFYVLSFQDKRYTFKKKLKVWLLREMQTFFQKVGPFIYDNLSNICIPPGLRDSSLRTVGVKHSLIEPSPLSASVIQSSRWFFYNYKYFYKYMY